MKTRKLFVVILALVLTLCMTATAFAGSKTVNDLTSEGGQNPVNIDVTGTYVESPEHGNVYKVDISWGAMSFSYVVKSHETWNPDTHKYGIDSQDPGNWVVNKDADNKDTNFITITNHSNDSITATPVFERNTSDDTTANVTGKFDGIDENNTSFGLKTAVGTEVKDAPAVTTYLTLEGALGADHNANTSVGTVKITLE